MPLCLATVLGSLKYLVLQGTRAYYDYGGVCVRFPPAQADKRLAHCHLSSYTRSVSERNNFNKKILHEITLLENKLVLPSMHTALCLCVILCVCFFSSSFFFFNFGCERYLMYQKQFVQTLFYQLKACTPC